MAKSMHCTVSGHVQGVFFRAWTQETARSLGLTGWVRNNPDGTVELEARGEEQTLDRFKEKLQQGPQAARVDDLACSQQAEGEDFSGFEIRY